MDPKHAFAHGNGGLDGAQLELLALRHLNAHRDKTARYAVTQMNGDMQALGLVVRISQNQPSLNQPRETHIDTKWL